MRVALVLLALSMLVAGCASPGADEAPAPTPGSNEPTPGPFADGASSAQGQNATTTTEPTAPTTDPTPASPEPTTEPSPSDPTPTPAATTPTPTPTPTPASFATIEVRHDFATLPENKTFAVAEHGALALEIEVAFEPGLTPLGTYACSGPLRVKVIGPDGAVRKDVLASQGTAAGPGARCGVVQYNTGPLPTDVPAGTWHADFSGQGVGTGVVTIRQA